MCGTRRRDDAFMEVLNDDPLIFSDDAKQLKVILDEAEVCDKEGSEFEEICEVVKAGLALEECSKRPPENGFGVDSSLASGLNFVLCFAFLCKRQWVEVGRCEQMYYNEEKELCT
ncbi:unnamed protein product [Amaranthus hypochondriacus]